MNTARWLLCALLGAAVGCSGGDGPSDGGGKADGGTPGGDGGTQPQAPVFETAVVEGLNSSAVVGDFAQTAVAPDGRFTVAYGYIPAGGGEREIHYAVEGSDGAWTPELVTVPGAAIPGGDDLKGLGLAYVGGNAHVVFLGGDDDGRATVEEPTDLVLGTRAGGQWSFRTLVDNSTEATGDCSVYCNEGFVVGSHAAIAANPAGGGFAVVYRDTHLGFATDDLNEADVEVYAEGGPVANVVVDPERSGGPHASIAYTPQGGLLVAYNVEFQPGAEDVTGVWAAVYTGGAWRLRRVMDSLTSAKIGAAAAADGTLYLAFFDTSDADLVVATSADDGDSWSVERVDSAGKTGVHPSLALDAEGRPVVAFTYCGPASDRSCPDTLGPQSKVRLARKEAGGWALYDVDDGQGFGRVGFFTSIAVAPDGKLGVAFTDDANGDLLFAREQ
jgi:hypothetical protein